MAISLYYLHNYEPDNTGNEPKKTLFSPHGLWLIKFLIILSAATISYLILFSKIVEPPVEEYVYQMIYSTVKSFNPRATSSPPALDFVAAEKALVTAPDAALAEKLKGNFLLQTESGGEAWYVNPTDGKKYYLGVTEEGIKILRRLTRFYVDMDITARTLFKKEEAGNIIINEREPGKLYYIGLKDRHACAVEEPDGLLAVIRKFGIGISNADIRKIEVGEMTDPEVPAPAHSLRPPAN